MIDIVELLKVGRMCDDKCRVMEAGSGCLCAEAADEITRLRAALAAQPAPSRETDWGPDMGKEVLPPAPKEVE